MDWYRVSKHNNLGVIYTDAADANYIQEGIGPTYGYEENGPGRWWHVSIQYLGGPTIGAGWAWMNDLSVLHAKASWRYQTFINFEPA